MPNKGRSFQLNLNNLLDRAITILLNNAPTLILYIDFNLYKDNNNDFIYSQVYSKSYVYIMSSFYYSPIRNNNIEVDFKRFQLASYYTTYIKDQVNKYIKKPTIKSRRKG